MDRHAIVVGASAGGVEALRSFAAGLPADLPCAVLVVLHVPAGASSALPRILDRAGPLPAAHANDGEPLQSGRIYVAPPDRHLLVADGTVSLSAGPRENGYRPAIDVLFRSAARAFGPAAIGVILSGSLDDGTAGLAAIASRGGLTIVQDPDDAAYPGMPTSAVEHVKVDYVLPVHRIPEVIKEYCSRGKDSSDPVESSDLIEREVAVSEFGDPPADGLHIGTPSGFTCPDCSGTLYEVPDPATIRFRCRVGHAWSQTSLAVEQEMALETALWTALRGLDEKVELDRIMAERAQRDGRPHAARRLADAAEESRQASRLIRQLLEQLAAGQLGDDPEGQQQAR